MNLQQLRKNLKEYLKKFHPQNYSKEVDKIISFSLKLDLNSIIFSDFFISEVSKKQIEEYVERIAKGEPLPYILQKVDFFGASFYINQHVLIPRVETEILANLVAKSMSKKVSGILFDICTGSGCLGISLKKKFPKFQVILTDNSEEALKIASINAEINETAVEIRKGDFLEAMHGQRADLIVSNPPYVSELAYENLDPSVKNFEPKAALIAPNNGLYFYQEFAKRLNQILIPGGILWLEIGFDQGVKVKEIFKEYFCDIIQDYSKHDRFAKIEL